MTFLGLWEKYAKEGEFISGDEVWIADYAFYSILACMVRRGLELVKNGFVALKEYVDRCEGLRL